MGDHEIHIAIGNFAILFLKDFMYLFLERGEWREKDGKKPQCEKERHWLVASSVYPDQGPNQHLRHVPWLGIKLATLWFAGLHSIHWATPAKAKIFLNEWKRNKSYWSLCDETKAVLTRKFTVVDVYSKKWTKTQMNNLSSSTLRHWKSMSKLSTV